MKVPEDDRKSDQKSEDLSASSGGEQMAKNKFGLFNKQGNKVKSK